jgi:NTE family protein
MGYVKSMAERLKVGLALGSGSARGLAHIGILSVLKEEGIPIDFVAGTSVGAVVGAYYALNLEIDTFKDKVSKMSKKDFLMLLDMPSKEGLKGDNVKKFLVESFKDRSFSDIKIPLKMVATDYLTGDAVIIDSGKLADGARASISIPGLFAPVKRDGKILIDGGLVDSTPVDIVKQMGAEVIIAVDLPVMLPNVSKNITMFEAMLQGFEIMRKRINNLIENEKIIVIRPEFSEVFTGFKFYNTRYIEDGRKAAKEALPRIKKAIGTS